LNDNDAIRIAKILSERFQVKFIPEYKAQKEGLKLALRPDGIPADEGFFISVLVGWTRITCDFIPSKNAGQLLIAMGQADQEKKLVFRSVSENARSKKGSIIMSVNGMSVNPEEIIDWTDPWRQLQLSLRSPYIETDGDLALDENLETYILSWTEIFLSMVMPLLPLVDENEENVQKTEGLPEGAQTKILVNRYERSRANRQACIAVHGHTCVVCGFDFQRQYGEEGRGYIEVHHIVPVSKLGEGYLINPIKDLIPVCANCHAMIHRRTPPYSADEIKQLLRSTAAK
jgi:5-methylcytosine-specific restriction protein A